MSTQQPVDSLLQAMDSRTSASDSLDVALALLSDTPVNEILEASKGDDSKHITDVPRSLLSSSKSSSFHPQSVTSTIAHEQTPFEEFSVQVKELCHLLWRSSSKEPRSEGLLRGSSNRLLGALRSKKVGRLLRSSSPPKEFVIERLTGGTFNRVVGITIIGSDGMSGTQMMLRVPRMEWLSTPDREVAVLRYVRQHTSIPVAEVTAFDFTSNKPLNKLYVVQTRLPGTNLHAAAKQREMTTDQWCTVARNIGRTMLELQKITNPTPGLIEASSIEDGTQSFSVCPFDIKSAYDPKWKEKVAAVVAEENATAIRNYEKSTLMFFAVQFGRWRADELRREPQGILYWDFMHRLIDAASQMDSVSCLGDDTNCLAHLDLAGRNTMVEFNNDGSLRVTGILDWDSAVFAPKFVSCAPPWWLWADENDTISDLRDESKASHTPAQPRDQAIKRAFEDTVGEDFLFYAYQPQFRLARRLFHIALTGNTGEMELASIESFLEDWAAFYKAEVEDYVPSETYQDKESSPEKASSMEQLDPEEVKASR